jgi:hypothetical protein
MNPAEAELLWRAVGWLTAQPRGGVAVRVWACLWSMADQSSDWRVKADRNWIAKKAGTTVGQVSRILTMLHGVGAIRRCRDRHLPGQPVVIWMVPNFRFPRAGATQGT